MICGRCRKAEVDPGYKSCGACRRARAAAEANRRKARQAAGLPANDRETQRRYDAKLRLRVIAAYGGRCSCCGEPEPAFLTIDHRHGVPAHHRKASGERLLGRGLYLSIIREGCPDDYRVLCWNCNAATAIYGTCPHETRLKVVA